MGARCMYYFVLLLIYLNVMGCILFFVCQQTYSVSSFKLDYLEELKIVEHDPITGKLEALNDNQSYIDEWNTAHDAIKSIQRYPEHTPFILAWVPEYDGYDGEESQFWRMYELSRLEKAEWDSLRAKNFLTEVDEKNGNWLFIWSICLYKSILSLHGTEMTPA